MAEDETRFIGGDQARRLRRPGQEIIENPGVLERNFPPETDEGIPSPPAVVETTPTAAGSTPAEERERARRQAEQQLRRNPPEEGDQGRSPDPRRGAGDQNTGSSALYDTESTDARREGDPTAAREAAPARPLPPHYFVERKHQVYYHDVIVYIEGQDVSDYLIGSVSVTYGLGSAPNKCDFRLDNAGHKFTLTPENLQQEQFRTVTQQRGLGSSFDYAETAKKEIFDRKKNPSYNPIDPESGGRRFPLHHWSTVFHKKDTVRVWIHNPASEADEWLPVFTGYLISKPISEDYITGSNTISMSCADIRYFMAKMRVNTNSVLAVLPGQQATTAADPTNRQPFTGLRVFSPQSNVEFDRSFFQDLVVQNNYENPWSALTFRQLVAALTFLTNSQRLVHNQNGQVERRIEASRREDLNRLSREISPLQQRLAAGQTLTTRQQERYDLLKNEIEQLGGSISESGAVSGGEPVRVRTVDDIQDAPEREVTAATRETDPSSTPENPPGAEGSGASAGTQGGRITYERAVPRGAGRIGRMRPGVYPTVQGAQRPAYAIADSIYPSVGASQERIRAWWQGWYRLCLFGSPLRTNIQSTQFAPSAPNLRGRRGISIAVSDGPLDHSIENRRYWTEDEVRAAGEGSRREGAWQCDAQAVHMILPSERAPTNDLIFGAGIISNSNVSQNLNWTNRLQLLTDACDTVDYRFWVSGTGDLIFEFAQYDFDPRDYGPFEEVLTLDHHLKNETFDEEGGEIVTAVVANGSYVGRTDVQEPGSFNQFIPRSVGTWSPSLASRHGLNVKVKNYSQVTSLSRLRRLALLEFQKLLAAADEYQIGIAFRPWLLLNKPIFNKYRERYALIDGIRWTLPVTAGSVAGHTVPTYNLTLNYTRSIDELGIPRFITGGPSQPMYFGARPEGRGNLLTALSQRIDSFSQAVQQLRSQENPVTTADIIELRETYNALVPQRQDSYNVIDAALQQAVTEGRSAGAPSTAVQALQAASAACQEVIDNAGALSDDEIRNVLRQCEEQANAARDEIRSEGRSTGAEQSPDGETAPSEGISGVRSTLGSESEPERPAEGPPPPEGLCYPGDPEMYSAPLGRQSLPGVPRFREWTRQIGRDLGSRRRRQILDSFGRGQVEDPFEGLTAPVGLWQEQNAFPRVVTSGFGKRGRRWHTGVDLPATLGDPVFACQDGIVIQSSPGRSAGGGLAVLHSGGYVTFYRHLGDRLVEIGDLVKRNQQIATVGLAGQEPLPVAQTHLHFECSAIFGSPAFEQYVGEGRRWQIIRPPQRDQLVRAGGGSSSTSGRERLGILDSTVSEGRDLGSVRIVNGLGSNQTSLATVSADLRDRFNLTFLRHRQGSDFTLPRIFMHYNPSCVGTDPFSGAEMRGSTSRSGGELISQRDYYSQFNLKGIPSVNQAVIPSGSRFGQQEVPEIPSGASDRRRRRLERQREAIIRQNERNAERQAAAQSRLDAQIALYNDATPPEECPPERYEGEVPRQPGEPLPDRQRISRAQAAGAYRRRASLSGDS